MRTIIGLLAAVVLALAIAAAGAALWLAYASLPQLAGELEVAGLDRPVRIARDHLGVPAIDAASERDAALALGFVHAQDRLWQMEASRRLGAGRLAEVVGEAAVGSDRLMRTLGLYRAAEAALEHLAKDAIERLEAYAVGVNAVLQDRRRPLPPEFLLLRHTPEPWRPADSLVLVKLMALNLTESWRGELTRASLLAHLPPEALADLWPPTRAEAVTTLPGDLLEREVAVLGDAFGDAPRRAAPALPPEVTEQAQALLAALPVAQQTGQGSNIWAVAGRHTATGAALLANDPHLRLGTPAHWYLAQIRTPEGLVTGATLPSLPVVVIGRNEAIAWGFTNTAADTDDLVVERVDPADPSRYLSARGSRPFVVREELIAVRGGEALRHVVRETRNGPVLSDILPQLRAAGEVLAGADHVLALRWTALDPVDRTLEAGMALARAGDWQAFSRAVERFEVPTQNAFYADREGAIGARLAGRLPLRASAVGDLPVPGWTAENDWLGYLPAKAHPAGREPESGYLLNANNRLVDDAYPHHVARHWNDDLRARRIDQLLAEATAGGLALDGDAMRRLQADRRSVLATDFLPVLLAIEPEDLREAEILAALERWDGSSAADRPEPLVFQAWYRAFVRHVLADELGAGFALYEGIRSDALRHILEQAPHWCDDVRTSDVVESCALMAARAFGEALVELEAAYGPDWQAWRWGQASRVAMPHRPFDAVFGLRWLFSLETLGGGDAGTVDVARYSPADPYRTVAAASLRVVADLSQEAALDAILPAGQSGHPLSPHFSDQKAAWRANRLHRIDIATDAREARHILRLVPANGVPDEHPSMAP